MLNTISPNINFKSGLNTALIKECRSTNVRSLEKSLGSKNIPSDFGVNRPVAFAVGKIFEIFNLLKKHAKIFDISAPRIQAYLKSDLKFNFNGYGFCVPETQSILKNQPPFETGSLFFQKENSIEEIDQKLDKSFLNNERSSSHYLAPFIHEFMHGIYIDYVYKKYGYEGECPYTAQKYKRSEKDCGLKVMEILQNLQFNNCENELIRNVLGKYAATSKNQYHEVFAETFTQVICKCLSDKDSLPIKNPLDELKTYPREFINIIKKLFV